MHREFKLWFLKLLVNVPVRLLDRFLKFPEKAEYPQTRMLLRTYGLMMKAYRLDRVQGIFGAKPDGNFERLLRTSAKVLCGVSEGDRYDRAWLGLAFILAKEEYFAQRERMDREDLVFEIRRQWESDLSFLPERAFEFDFEGFLEYALANYLCNLARKQVTYKQKMEVKKENEYPKNRKKRSFA